MDEYVAFLEVPAVEHFGLHCIVAAVSSVSGTVYCKNDDLPQDEISLRGNEKEEFLEPELLSGWSEDLLLVL